MLKNVYKITHHFLCNCENYTVDSFTVGSQRHKKRTPRRMPADDSVFAEHRIYFLITSMPIYGRSTSGTVTEPSSFWYCSTIAGMTRLVAKPDAFSV